MNDQTITPTQRDRYGVYGDISGPPFYVWDFERASICHPVTGQFGDAAPWDLATRELAQEAADRLNTRHAATERELADKGMREALKRFVDLLTNGGANRDNMLSIDHDALRAAIVEARAALQSVPVVGEENETELVGEPQTEPLMDARATLGATAKSPPTEPASNPCRLEDEARQLWADTMREFGCCDDDIASAFLTLDGDDLMVVRAIKAALSRSAGVRITPEMIEAACQARDMRQIDCDWTDGMSEGQVAIERMLAEKMLTAAIRPLSGKEEDRG